MLQIYGASMGSMGYAEVISRRKYTDAYSSARLLPHIFTTFFIFFTSKLFNPVINSNSMQSPQAKSIALLSVWGKQGL